MIEREIDCYLCGKKVSQREDYDTSRNIMIECPDCMDYELTDKVMKAYFDQGKVTDEVKEKMRKLIKERYMEEPVMITTATMRVLIG